ncbi:MAG: hypothetical protein AB4042_16790 [Leptolyngbyaceae cyanobacterium]
MWEKRRVGDRCLLLSGSHLFGGYWHSYMLCSANSELFDCTPYDKQGEIGCPEGIDNPPSPLVQVGSTVRCDRCVEQVLNSPTIYLVKQDWLEQFPRRIEQFGYCLERSGRPLKVARYRIAPYRKLE